MRGDRPMRALGAANAPCSAAVARRRREHRQTIVPREWFGRADASVGERWPATAWLCIGPVGLLDGTGRERASAPLIVVDLPPLVLHEPVNTVLLSFTEAWTGRYAIVTGAGRTLGTGTVAAGDLFRDMQLGRRLQVALARVTDDERWAGARSFVPLVCASCETARRGAAIVERNLHFYSQIEFSTEGALFMRTSRTPYVRITGEGDGLATELGLPAGEALSWLSEALVLHAQHGDVLANWREYPRKCLAGREVEVKLTLHGVVDPWVLAVRAHQSARRRELPGYVAAYGNGFRRSES